MHWRYNFRNPQLGPRDYAAIEYQVSFAIGTGTSAESQLRKMSRVLEMLEDNSVQRVSLSSEMEHWWEGQVRKSTSTTDPTHPSATGHSQPDADRQQWSHTLPGHGGT